MDDFTTGIISNGAGGGAIGGLIAFLHKIFIDKKLSDLERAQLTAERDAARTYVTKEEHKSSTDTVTATLNTISAKIDRLSDKLDTKMDKP